MKQGKKELRKYTAPGWYAYIAAGIYAAIMLVALIRGTLVHSKNVFNAVTLGIGAAVLSGPPILKIVKARKAIRREYAENRGDAMAADFAEAEGYFDDRLRAGKHYLFGRKNGVIIRYGDIGRVYQHIRKTNLSEESRKLKAVNLEGKTITLCRLKTGGDDDVELQEVIDCIVQANPNVELGYHG